MRTTLRRQATRAKRLVTDRGLSPVAKDVRRRNLTYLRPDRLDVLEACARSVRQAQVPGDFVECGVALGGSAVVLASAMGPGRRFHGYDVFGMIPAPTEADPPAVHERYAMIRSGASRGIGGDPYYGYRDDLLEFVSGVLAEFGHPVGEDVHLHQGLFDDTLEPSAPVALAHVDSDWYEPVRTCVRRIGPWLSEGGYIVLDDYDDYDGCRRAVDEFLDEEPAFWLERFASNAALRR